jgi:hypothetical protein
MTMIEWRRELRDRRYPPPRMRSELPQAPSDEPSRGGVMRDGLELP